MRTEIACYLRTGDYDPAFFAWSGDPITRAVRADAELRRALIAEVQRRARVVATPPPIDSRDLVAFTRARVEPMVRGLFPRREQAPVLALLERSVVFLIPATIEGILQDADWLGTAWNLANLYLGSVGAELLSEEAHRLVGLSEETTCYLSAEYFRGDGRFSDFLVHEAAHIFHNCKRRTVGLPETSRREWLLQIDFRKRETFAYASEAFSRILELGGSRADRWRLFDELARQPPPADERVEPGEYLEIMKEAITHRNGWKRILLLCAPRT